MDLRNSIGLLKDIIELNNYSIINDIIIDNGKPIDSGNYSHICPICNRKHKGNTSKSKWCKACFIIKQCPECKKYYIKTTRQNREESCCGSACARKVSVRKMNISRDVLAVKQGYKCHNDKVKINADKRAQSLGFKDNMDLMKFEADEKAKSEGYENHMQKMISISKESAKNQGYSDIAERMRDIGNKKAIDEGYNNLIEKICKKRNDNAIALGYNSYYDMIKERIDIGPISRGFKSQFDEMIYLSNEKAKSLGYKDRFDFLHYKLKEWYSNMSEEERENYSKSLSKSLNNWWNTADNISKTNRIKGMISFSRIAWEHYRNGTASEEEIKFCESGVGFFDRDAFYASDYDIFSFEVNGVTESDMSLSDFVAKYDNVCSVKAYELVDENNNLIETLDVAKTNGTIGEISWFHRTMKVAKEQKDLSEEELLKLPDHNIRLKRRKYLEEMDKYPNSKIRVKIIFSYDHKVKYNSDEEKYLYNIESQYAHDSKALFWNP